MKIIKLYKQFINEAETYMDVDPYDEEIWEDPNFLYWLKKNYPDEIVWTHLTHADCSSALRNDTTLLSLEGIENLTNLKYLNCSYNKLDNLNPIEELTNIEEIWCKNNNLTSLHPTNQKTFKKRALHFMGL